MQYSRAEIDGGDSSDSYAAYLGGQGNTFYLNLGVNVADDETDVIGELGARYGSEGTLGGLGLYIEVSGGLAGNRDSDGVPLTTSVGLNYNF